MFHAKCSFNEIKSHGKVFFENTIFHDKSYFCSTAFNGGLSFDGTKFLKEVYFDDTIIKNSFSIKNTVFEDEKYLSTIKIEKIKESNKESFRYLKEYFESVKDFVNANLYYKLEHDQWLKELTPHFLSHISKIVVLCFGKILSNHLTIWVLPIFWFFVLSILDFLQN